MTLFICLKGSQSERLANCLADHPIPDDQKLNGDLWGEEVFFMDVLSPWEMYLDGVVWYDGVGAGVVLISHEKNILPYSFILTQLFSNNMAVYPALLLGLHMATGMGVKDLDVYGHSQLVINQLIWEFGVKKDRLETVKLEHVPRTANNMADVLTKLQLLWH